MSSGSQSPSVAYCVCPDNSYPGMNATTNQLACLDCPPRGAKCDGKSPVPFAQSNWWHDVAGGMPDAFYPVRSAPRLLLRISICCNHWHRQLCSVGGP